MSQTLLEALHSGRVLLMDGAMGTELQRAGIASGECYEQWNLTHPERVLAIHQAYVNAGAEVLLTNTFQANPVALAKHHLQDRWEEITRSGVRLARQACGANGFVLGDVGPGTAAGIAEMGFAEGLDGSDGILLETQSHPPVAVSTNQLILLSFTFRKDANGQLQTFPGADPETIARSATKSGIAALGVNCGLNIGMDECTEIIRRYRRVTDLPLFARPNAGTPTQVGDRWVYPHSPEAMAAQLPTLLQSGVSMVGGCCGTTPAHIAAFRSVVDAWNTARAL